MITKEFLDSYEFEMIEYCAEKSSFLPTFDELTHFDIQEKELMQKVRKKKLEYAKEHNFSSERAYDQLEIDCLISADTMRKTIVGTTKCSRKFLYKFTVGLHMSVDEANEYFTLCDGPLTEKCKADYICISALNESCDIQEFVDFFEDNTGIKLVKKPRPSK